MKIKQYLNEGKKMPFDIKNVGKSKALGYYPLNFLKKDGFGVDEVIDYADNNGLKHIVFNKSIKSSIGGAVYIYSPIMLKKQIQDNKIVLEKAGIPTDSCENFIYYISDNFVNDRAAYGIIGRMYNDKRFRDKK